VKRATKRTARKRTYRTDDEKRAILAEIDPAAGRTVAGVARKHGVQRTMLVAWGAKFGPQRMQVAALVPGPRRTGADGKLDALVRAIVAEELGPIVERELPAAIERALARAFGTGGKRAGV
jgi:hypothetical protein